MFDLELIAPKQKVVQYKMPPGWSMEQGTELFYEINKQFDAVNNLVAIRSSLKKYGKTPQLRDLVGASFEGTGVSFSVEGITESIKKFFKWAKEKLAKLWTWFKGLFTLRKRNKQAKERVLNAVEEVADAVQSGNEQAIETAKDKLQQSTKTTPNKSFKEVSKDSTTSVKTVKFSGIDLKVFSDTLPSFFQTVNDVYYLNPDFFKKSFDQQLDTLNELMPLFSKFKTEIKEKVVLKTTEWPIDIVKALVENIRKTDTSTDKWIASCEKKIQAFQKDLVKLERTIQEYPDEKEFQTTAKVLKLRIAIEQELLNINLSIEPIVNKMINNMATALMQL